MRYYMADPHFFHEGLNTKMDCRGFGSAEEMNEYILMKWNAKVRSKDDVVILGDLSFGKAEETNALLRRLQGRLYLILGNHDKLIKNKDFDAGRFEWIKPYEEWNDHKRKVILCHYPILCYNGQYRLDGNGKPKVYMLHGHIHNTYDQRLVDQFQEITRNSVIEQASGERRGIPSNIINCFCMYSDYTPLTLDEWIICDQNRRKEGVIWQRIFHRERCR